MIGNYLYNLKFQFIFIQIYWDFILPNINNKIRKIRFKYFLIIIKLILLY